MIATDTDWIPSRKICCAVAEHIGDNAHRMPWWIDIRAARNVLLQDIVLYSAGELAHISSLLFRYGNIQREQDTGCGIYRHRGADTFQGQTIKQCLHIFQAGDRDTHFANLPL